MIRCSKCGTLNEADATFCRQCDAFLEWSGESVDETGETSTRPPAPPPPPGEAGSQPAPAKPRAAPTAARSTSPAATTDEPTARRPEKGAVTPQRKAKTPEPTAVERPKPGQRICPTCGTGNDPERKFCRRCGNTVGAADIEAGLPPTPEPEKKGRRWGFLGRLGREARQEASMAGRNPQSLLSAPSRLRMRGSFLVYGLLGALGLGALASYAYLPDVSDTVDGVVGEVMHTIKRMTADRDEVVITEARARSEPAFPAGNLYDEDTTTWWAGGVSQNGRWQLDFELQEPTDLFQVNIDSGAYEEAYSELGRPSEILLRADGELYGPYTLKNSSDQQPIEIDIRGVSEVRIIVNSQHIGQEGGDVIAIREVAFVGPVG